jgi:hypothetical protein
MPAAHSSPERAYEFVPSRLRRSRRLCRCRSVNSLRLVLGQTNSKVVTTPRIAAELTQLRISFGGLRMRSQSNLR